MENTTNFKLIDGEFTAEETQKVLMSLINNKIDFHSLFAFSNHIRFNQDTNASKRRIEELTSTRDEIAELTKLAQSEGFSFRIKSNVSLELIKKPILVK